MNHKLIRAIISSTWLIREDFAASTAPLVANFLNGEGSALSELKSSNTVSRLQNASSNGKNNKVVAVMPISDVIMKDDFCGTMGTRSMIDKLKELDADPSVGAVVLSVDTPGGQSALLYNFYQQVTSMNGSTPVYSFLSSQCCSAGYYMVSGSTKIYASSKIDEVGSIGTMCQLIVPNKDSKHQAPYSVKAVYASKSTDKNRAYHEAIDGKEDLLRTSQLDPINELFHECVQSSRSNLDSSVLSGAVYFAEEAIDKGLIDGIKSLDEVIQEAFSNINDTEMGLFNKSKNKKSMKKFDRFSAILGREVTEETVLSADDMAKINEAMENSETTAEPTTSAEQLAEINNRLNTLANATEGIAARLETLENAPGAEQTQITPKKESEVKNDFENNPWDDPNSKLNQAAAKALGL